MIHFPQAIAIHLFDKLRYYRLRRSSCFCHVEILWVFFIYAKVHALLFIVILTLVVQNGFNQTVSLGSDSIFNDWRTIFRKLFFFLN